MPFVFVYSPALLLVADGFSWQIFAVTFVGALCGIGLIGAAFTGYLIKSMPTWARWYTGAVSLMFIAPGLNTMIIGIILLVPVGLQQLSPKNI